jgi:hypothetical protein
MGQSFVAGGLVTSSATLGYGHIVAHTATCLPLPGGRFTGMLQRQSQTCSPLTLTKQSQAHSTPYICTCGLNMVVVLPIAGPSWHHVEK